MILSEALDRAYDALGDRRANPRHYSRSHLVGYMNRACMLFRSLCHDVWYRVDIPAVASQGQYTVPPEILELRRVAFDDETLEARAVNVIQSRDATWQDTTGTPVSWTSVGFAHDKFWLWPKPIAGSDETFTWSPEYGVTVRYQDPAGANYTFTRDPAGPGTWNPEYGLVVTLTDTTTTSDYGDIFYISAPDSNQITLWGTAHPGVMVGDDAEIPIRRPWQQAVVWYTLWQVYDEEGDHHNGILAAYYRDEFLDLVERCRLRASNPVPAQVRALRGGLRTIATPAEEARYGSSFVNGGVPQNIEWPSENW